MGLFSSILRFGIQNGKKNLADVTALVLPEPPSIGFHSIEIHSNVDLDVHFGAEQPTFKILSSKEEKDCIAVAYEYDENVLKLRVQSKSEKIHGVLKLGMQRLDRAVFNAENADVTVKKASVENLEVSSRNGDIFVSIEEADEIYAETTAGDIAIKIKSNDFKIETKSENGDVTLVGVASKKKSGRKITCKSQDGDILIEKRQKE